MKHKILCLPALLCILALACNNTPGSRQEGNAQASAKGTKENYLSMKINGVAWTADHDVFGAFHPKGYNKAIIISGSKGPKDKNEQAFNINLYNADGPGVYNIQKGNPDLSVAQLGNMSPENFLYGSMMGFDMRVNVSTSTTMPDAIEATFEGTMTGNAGDVLKITEGKFYYHE